MDIGKYGRARLCASLSLLAVLSSRFDIRRVEGRKD